MHSLLIIDTGGTFNKRYNPLTGNLDVDGHSQAVRDIASKWLCELPILSIIGKDSLEMDDTDRETIAQTIIQSEANHILIIHGTDTMSLTAEYLAQKRFDKSIVLTGAMVPYSIDPVEATANFALALGYLTATPPSGVTIAMHGIILPHAHIAKSYELGKFVPTVEGQNPTS